MEISATLITIIGIWLAAKANSWNWLFSIVASAVYTYIFFHSQLYGDATLNFIFIILSFYGWYEWVFSGIKNNSLKISSVKKNKKIIFTLCLSFIVGAIFTIWLLKKTNTNVPYLDGITTVLSLIATWMSAKKIIENWIIWIFTNTIYIGIYYYKHLYPTAVLYFILALLAIYGMYEWKKIMKTA
ncbi:MAG: nicotinamide riboside transporter PnuC [Bacteroidia bacterium]